MVKVKSEFRSALARLSFCGAMLPVGCTTQSVQSPRPSNALAPTAPWISEACLSSTNDQINSFIDDSMRSITASRNLAASCHSNPVTPFPAQACPPGTYPGYCGGSLQSSGGQTGSGSDTDTKAAYNNWLGFIAGSIRIYAPVPPGSGLHPPYDGLGDQYGPIAEAAQALDQQAYACQSSHGGSTSGTFYPPGSNSCGKDVLCMQNQVQAASFLNVGEGLFIHFRGCSSDIRNYAAQYLDSQYFWH